ncbi:MAG: hypothetical protein IJD85_03595, partial [Oscillospiraceae bacterium]|nr:hypothetical protein [Oscillospiraceae bacterium]
ANGETSPKKSKVEKKPFSELVATGHADDMSEEDFFLTSTWQRQSDKQAHMLAYLDAKDKKYSMRKEKRKRDNDSNSDWDDETYEEASDSEDIGLNIVEIESKASDAPITTSEPDTTALGSVSVAPPVVQPSSEHQDTFPLSVESTPSSIELAEHIVNKHTFVNYQGKVYMFDECVYKHMSTTELKHFCFGFFYNEIRNRGKPNFAKEIADALESLILSRPPIVTPKVKKYLVLRNCRLNLETFMYEPNAPDYFETICVQVDYDPNATSCPYFDKYLQTISQGDQRMAELTMEVMAYSIMPNCPVKKFFLAYGEKDCGKSVMISLTSSLLPDEAVSTITLHEMGQRFKSGSLMNARLNVDADLPDKVIPDDDISKLKKLTGVLDRMEGEKKFEQGQGFHPECKLLFASNHFLRMRNPDEAFLSRLIVIPFRYSVPKEQQDEHLIEHLLNERSAIFNKIIKRYRRLAANHFEFSICTEPEKYCKSTANNMDRASLFAFSKFVTETLVFTGNEKDFVATQAMSELFDVFSTKNGCTELRRNFPALLSSYMKENYADTVKNVRRGANNARGYSGVRLASSER